MTPKIDGFSYEAIVARIQEKREGLGWTQTKLDAEAGLSRGHTCSVEGGRRGSHMPVATVVQYAIALGVDVGWLITGVAPSKGVIRPSPRPRAALRES